MFHMQKIPNQHPQEKQKKTLRSDLDFRLKAQDLVVYVWVWFVSPAKKTSFLPLTSCTYTQHTVVDQG